MSRKMQVLKLIYYLDRVSNLGDLLSPYIIGRLSGLPVQYKYILGIKGMILASFRFLCHRISREKFDEVLFPWESNILGIGSILAWGNRKSIVWGSGFMNRREKFHGGKIYAVRGKLTNEKLIADGFRGCSVFGDPALLLPILIPIPLQIDKLYDIAIIPHWSEFDYFSKKYGSEYRLLDIRTGRVKAFIKSLVSCRCVLSSSLHGIILAHAYNIPALWIKYGDIGTDGFKFHDYFSSVDIPLYDGISNFEPYLKAGNWKELFTNHQDCVLPHIDIRLLQKKLLEVAPFKLLSQYESMIR